MLDKLGYTVKDVVKNTNIDILTKIENGEITAKEALDIFKSRKNN